MPKFRKRPNEIEAEQYLLMNSPRGVCYCEEASSLRLPHVHTAHNNQAVFIERGDWIVPEPDGEHFYPVKPDIFAATYEPAE